ncbi:MAG: hypothetical protein KDA75_04630 [Planctomycetaceae bacterium]|nr:hypothetical protein [Planctomycetaceae bacterium]
MFFRFTIVVITLIALALAGISIEKRNVELRRSISLQEYRRQQLIDRRARLRLQVERWSAPDKLLDRTAAGEDTRDAARQ